MGIIIVILKIQYLLLYNHLIRNLCFNCIDNTEI